MRFYRISSQYTECSNYKTMRYHLEMVLIFSSKHQHHASEIAQCLLHQTVVKRVPVSISQLATDWPSRPSETPDSQNVCCSTVLFFSVTWSALSWSWPAFLLQKHCYIVTNTDDEKQPCRLSPTPGNKFSNWYLEDIGHKF